MPSPSPIHFCLQKNTRDNTEKTETQSVPDYPLCISRCVVSGCSILKSWFFSPLSSFFSSILSFTSATWCVCPVELLLQQFCLLWFVSFIDDWTLPLRNDWHWIFWQQLANMSFSLHQPSHRRCYILAGLFFRFCFHLFVLFWTHVKLPVRLIFFKSALDANTYGLSVFMLRLEK